MHLLHERTNMKRQSGSQPNFSESLDIDLFPHDLWKAIKVERGRVSELVFDEASEASYIL